MKQQRGTRTTNSTNIGIIRKIILRFDGLERGVDDMTTVVDGEAVSVGTTIKRCLL